MTFKIDKPKMIIAVRKDLRMKKGKMSSQVAHAALGGILKQMSKTNPCRFDLDPTRRIDCVKYELELRCTDPIAMWLGEAFTKIVVGVDSLEEMLMLQAKADDAGLATCLITDNGDTVFTEPTVTTLAIGPAFSSELYPVTGHLRTI